MGKTPKPLTILVTPPLDQWEEVAALQAQGHSIHVWGDQTTGFEYADHDLILGPTCWRMDAQHRKYLDLAITEARRARYPTEKKGD